MSEEQNISEEIEKNPVKGKQKRSRKKSKFLTIGKYFLILALIGGQAYLSYAIVDNNYEQVYSFLNKPAADDIGIYQIEELIVNPAETNGKRYLLVEISLELRQKDHISLLENKKMEIKQNIIEALSDRTIDELIHSEGRELLRSELSGIINVAIGVRSVRNLYFTKYVMQ
ncbi:MAG TPA: flagellar basal body-associated FliL family protein [Halalkalibaculum sp.]|nr:flagellar basal body-associated FliL family protein [Halalkalibaculum sp.]